MPHPTRRPATKLLQRARSSTSRTTTPRTRRRWTFAGQLASAHAGISVADEDWYSFSAPKSDPATIRVTYTVPDGVDTNLALYATDVAGDTIDGDSKTGRSGLSQTLSVTFESAVGHSYRADVSSNGDACVAYDLTVDTLSCTDVYEDNDEDSHAAIIDDPGRRFHPDVRRHG